MIAKHGLLLILYMVLAVRVCSQEPDTRHLFYCNENKSVEQIVILSQQNFLGWAIDNGRNFLVLYDQHRLPVDTLILGNNATHMLQHIWPISHNKFYVHLLNRMGVCSVANNRFSGCEYFTGKAGLPYIPLWQKNNRDVYVYADYTGRKQGRYKTHFVITEAGDHKIITKNLEDFGFYMRPDKTMFEFFVDNNKHELILPVEWAGSVAFINENDGTCTIKRIPLDKNRTKGFFYYYDYVHDQHYFMRHEEGKSTYGLFEISRDFSYAKPVTELDFIPGLICGGHALKALPMKKSGKSFTCYYLMPLSR